MWNKILKSEFDLILYGKYLFLIMKNKKYWYCTYEASSGSFLYSSNPRWNNDSVQEFMQIMYASTSLQLLI